ncbi:MAG: hypothetical protein ACM3ZC_09775 [Bacteroidota bacterium]
MLDPNIRRLYLDELKPPAPYVLDRAVGTTFSLDLLSLLVVPLSLAFSEAGGEEALRDQIAVLEALQRTADRLGIFCQQGRIAVPRADSLLYSYLEPAVIEVRPPGGKGVFHPKIWLLRFTADGLPPLHRFVCLSRNLTFDQSWDTVLTLEGTVEEGRKNAFSRNRPLAAFIAALPSLAVGPVPASLREHVEMLADEVLRVRFRVPDGFNEEEYDFIPLGLKGYRQPPAFKDHSRMMIVSPFLSGDALAPLAVAGTNNVLISRGESLDALPPGLLDKIRVRTQVYILNEAAEKPDTEDEEFERGEDLSGLHAKLYVAEHGWNARLLTGSANATDAAFHQNVEFLVELRGRRAQIGIDKILGEREERGSLLGMLLPYQPGTVDDKAKIRKELEQLLEQARQAVAGAGLSLKVTPEPGGTYALSLAGNEPLALASNLGAACYPITLDRNHARDLASLKSGATVDFPGLSAASLTSFLAFRLGVETDGEKAGISFVLNLPATGMPEGRYQEILRRIVSDKGQFLRYLLFLLSDDPGAHLLACLRTQSGGVGADGPLGGVDLPLLEELVKAYSRKPEKLAHISRLIDDLQSTEEGRAVLPEGFLEVWAAFQAACGKEEVS